MNLMELAAEMLLPEHEILVNKITAIRGGNVILASLTEQQGKVCLWAICHWPRPSEDDNPQEKYGPLPTNREEKLQHMGREDRSFFISKIEFGESEFNFYSSSVCYFGPEEYAHAMQLQHFVEKGVDCSSLAEVPLRDIAVVCFTAEEGSSLKGIKRKYTGEIAVDITEEFREHRVGQTFTLNINQDMPVGQRLCFQGPEGERHFYYIDKLECHNLWKEMKENWSSQQLQNVMRETGQSYQQLWQAHQESMQSFRQLCPENCGLATVVYETEEDIQLNFHTKEYLDKKPVHENQSIGIIGGSEGIIGQSSGFVALSSDGEKGKNGYRLQYSAMEPVPLNFDGALEVELFSWYEKIPAETLVL